MNQTNVKVSFYLKKSESDADGYCPVMARLNIGKYSESAFSMKLRVPQKMWADGRLLPMYANSTMNFYLKHIAVICGIDRRLGFYLTHPSTFMHQNGGHDIYVVLSASSRVSDTVDKGYRIPSVRGIRYPLSGVANGNSACLFIGWLG